MGVVKNKPKMAKKKSVGKPSRGKQPYGKDRNTGTNASGTSRTSGFGGQWSTAKSRNESKGKLDKPAKSSMKPKDLEKSEGPSKKSKSREFWDLQKRQKELRKGIKQAESDEEFIEMPQQDTITSDNEKRSESETEDENIIQDMQVKQNKKNKKSGGFQSMGLSYPVYKSILHQGYKIPTPIQRKTIPIILNQHDIVAMARTGSGKTAAFLIPIVEKLKQHSAKVGARALILSPSRELAQQTLKFACKLAKYTDLRISAFIGGDRMEDQFQMLSSNPDIIIATPGRLMHLIIETKLELQSVQILCFDEADRLFEMGFKDQMHEIISKVPTDRQTLLFSATLPKILVDFARAGLVNPKLIRLDVDTKISSDLQMYCFSVKQEEKDAALVYLLMNKLKEDEQTIVFASTKHHVEYLNELLSKLEMNCTFAYGSLDQLARNQNLAKFRTKEAKILIVTDVAARGIDIPFLDNVINYDFPGSSKLFIHRVGRTARAGRPGHAFSFVTNDELPFLIDLQLFTSRNLLFSSNDTQPDYTKDITIGYFPPGPIATEMETLNNMKKGNVQLESLANSCKQGYKLYLKTRPTAAKTSYVRAKELLEHNFGIHGIFDDLVSQHEKEQIDVLQQLSRFRPSESVFEVGKRGSKAPEAALMVKRRRQLDKKIQERTQSVKEMVAMETEKQKKSINDNLNNRMDIEGVQITSDFNFSKESKMRNADSEFKLEYRPADDATEKGYSAPTTEFSAAVNTASIDIIPDDSEGIQKKRQQLQWDSKIHQFVRPTVGADNKKRIKTDTGALIPASFKTDRYEKWKKSTKMEIGRIGEQELTDAKGNQIKLGKRYRYNEIHGANVKSKSFKRKASAAEAKMRKQGLRGDELTKKMTEWTASKTANPVPAKTKLKRVPKCELKTPKDVAKERYQKDLRREKTGRHNINKGKK